MLLFGIALLPAQAQGRSSKASKTQTTESRENVPLLRQETSKLSVRDVSQLSTGWAELGETSATVRGDGLDYWIKWPLANTSADEALQMLSVTPDAVDSLDIWLLDSRKRVVRHFESGAVESAKTGKFSLPGLWVPLPSRTGLTMFARVRTSAPLRLMPTVVTHAQFEQASDRQLAIYAMGAGAILAMTLFALLMSAMLREPAFMVFVLWAPLAGFWFANEVGLAFHYLWPDKPHWNDYSHGTIAALMSAAYALLSIFALDATAKMRAFFGIVFRALLIAGLCIAGTVSLVPAQLTLQMAWLVLMGVTAFTMISALVRLIGRTWVISGYLLASVLQLMTLGAALAKQYSLPGIPIFDDAVILAGLIASMVVTCAGLAQRLYSADRLRQFAQSNLISSHRAATARLEENVKARTFELELANEQLSHVSRVDGLTGVFNRRCFDDMIQQAIAKARDRAIPLAVMMVDLDFFKKLNDEHGHAAGDVCLIRAAKVTAETIPREDGSVARYGGEEFVVLLTSTDKDHSLVLAERIRNNIESASVLAAGKPLRMTASIGLYCAVPDSQSTPEQFLKCADAALYQAKESGRNRVMVASGLDGQASMNSSVADEDSRASVQAGGKAADEADATQPLLV